MTRRNPAWTVVGLEELSGRPTIGEHVIAVQPDSDDGDFVSNGRVEAIDDEHQLVYLSIAWGAFVVAPPIDRMVTKGSRFRSFSMPTSRGSSPEVRIAASVAA
ncbi:hypothetical protein LK09_06105 [Microbacterium mangrovi]|uniref:Uncharacterized protein n=1 Tax=Microbacterium mangrovi TaxID=1348253 RepID=A0A0B2AA90_9MICO|nr:hypothetical protein LK09_06105 [Microbacterium mangrovi]